MLSSNGDDKREQIDHEHSDDVGLIKLKLINKDEKKAQIDKDLVINEEGMEMLRRYEKLKKDCEVEDNDLKKQGSDIYNKYHDDLHTVVWINGLAEIGLILSFSRLSIISRMTYFLPALFFLIALGASFSALKRAKKRYADLGMIFDIFTNRNINFIRLATAFRDHCIAGKCSDSTSSLRRPHKLLTVKDLSTVNERLEELLRPSVAFERMKRQYGTIRSPFIFTVAVLTFLMLAGSLMPTLI